MTLLLNGTNGVSDVDGSASTPAIRGTDTNTGIFFPAADTIAFAEGGAEVARFDSSGNLGIGITTPQQRLHINDSSSPRIKLTNATTGTGSSDGSEIAIFDADNSLRINNLESANILFGTGGSERMRIDSSGNLLVGTTDAGIGDKGVVINSAAYLGDNYGRINIKKTFSGNVVGVNFSYNNGTVGNITYSNTATAYNTSSDYRLKENIAPMTGALAKVSALKPVTYTWKADGSDGQGFIAHELQEVVPDCVTGEKDAVDAEGNPVYQGIDTSFLVATLTAAIQEQQAIITDLKSRIEALEQA